ncbi:MAG: CinA family protein [Proteobacteria bacterium]|nr:CinA family protein [Pseudomonadota bacterium]
MSLEEKATALLESCKAKGVKVTTAESCTGGLVSMWLTEITGSSEMFDCGFVTYSYASKTQMLGVPQDMLKQYGAVSAPVAEAMVRGALARSKARVALSITGVAGPGASESKPAGLVYIGLGEQDHDDIRVVENRFTGSRAEVRRQSAEKALDMLCELINSY